MATTANPSPTPPSTTKPSEIALLAGIGLLLGTTVAAWGGLQVGALIDHRRPAQLSPVEVAGRLTRLVTHLSDPAVVFPGRGVGSPVASGIGLAVASLITLAIVAGVAVLVARRRSAGHGLARRHDIRAMTARALLRRAVFLRPSLARASIDDVGYPLGRLVGGPAVYGSIEDSLVVVAPARSGKTRGVIAPVVRRWSGPAVVTETRPDNFRLTVAERLERGPVWLWDPSGVTGDLPDGVALLRWSPVRGCGQPETAILRATAIVDAAGGDSGVTNADYWRTKAITVLQGYLHAAALAGRSIEDVCRWAADPLNTEPITLLRDLSTAPWWADDLYAEAHGDPDTRGNVWAGLRLRLAALSSPTIRSLCAPDDGDAFDPERFLAEGGTVYFAGTAEQQKIAAPIIAACITDITETARTLAAGSPNNRLDPPLLLALDEVANVAPLHTLPTLLSDGGGSGIVTIAVLQTLAQARERWGEHRTTAMLAGATGLLRLGGERDARDLDDFSKVAGELEEHVWTTNESGQNAGRSSQIRQRRVVPVEWLRSLEPGHGVLLYRSVPPAHVRFALPAPDRSRRTRLRPTPSTGRGHTLDTVAENPPDELAEVPELSLAEMAKRGRPTRLDDTVVISGGRQATQQEVLDHVAAYTAARTQQHG